MFEIIINKNSVNGRKHFQVRYIRLS